MLAVQIQEQEVQIQYSVQLHQLAAVQEIITGLVQDQQVVQVAQAVVQEQIQLEQVEVVIHHQLVHHKEMMAVILQIQVQHLEVQVAEVPVAEVSMVTLIQARAVAVLQLKLQAQQ